MIVFTYSNIDIIQGVIGYGNATEGITDWRITNTNSGIFNILNSSSIITPSGGTSEIGEIPGSTDRYMIFTAGPSTFTVPSGGIKCDILVVGGGGGGGNDRGGGGGAGGLVFQTGIILNGTINVLVGSGGIASITDTATGGNGGSSSIGSIIALGGGGGGSEQSNANNGGSGGGSAYSYLLSHFGTGDQPTSSSGGYGNRGGDARDLTQTTTNRGCGGGGGAGTRGLEATSVVGGAGGDGLAGVGNIDFKTHFNLPTNNTVGHYISGENKVYFAGGGGGGDCVDGTTGSSIHGLGGKGGGVNGTTTANIRGTIIANCGGGGGGGTLNLPIGSNGGSGIVIIRYSTANISIIDNGNVGFGITPTTNSSLVEIAGDVNITGNYKINNVDIINSSSNYVLSTSNLLVSRISTGIKDTSNYVSTINTSLNTRINNTSNYMLTTSNILSNYISNQWISTSSGIYYNTPISTPITLPNEIGVEKYMIFTYTGDTIAGSGQTQYTINIPTGGILCDILMVGGGGAGGIQIGSGGGGGAVLYATNVSIPSNTYTIRVGRGGIPGEVRGKSTEGFEAIVLGGGCANNQGWGTNTSVDGNSGGSGGGGKGVSSGFPAAVGGTVGISTKGTILNTSTLYNGNIGGSGSIQNGSSQPVGGGGGGGAGGVGGNGSSTTGKGGDGGIGVEINITGTTYWWAAGGGSSSFVAQTGGSGGKGGGGGGNYWLGGTYSTDTIVGTNGYGIASGKNAGDGTGSGGGGATNLDTIAGNGGSGIIIIKYYSIQQTIQKSISSSLVTSATVTTGITTGPIGASDGYMMFTYTTDNTGLGQTRYALNITQNIICDLLIVGGGGGGARRFGGGGGAGALIYESNLTFPVGTYYIHVGNGGIGNSRAGNLTDAGNTVDNKRAQNGFDSEIISVQNTSLTPITIYRAKGGGGGLGGNSATSTTIFPNEFSPLTGGSGGGNGGKDGAAGGLLSILNIVNGSSVSVINNIASDSVNPSYVGGKCFGNEGGRGGGDSPWLGSGGGGAGSRGTDVNTLGIATANNFAGVGGIGLQYSITGSSVYYAGGGGGGNWDTSGSAFYNDGGLGGGGRSSTKTVAPIAGSPNTGGGGGGDGADVFSGANGGSGVVIIKYYSIQQTVQQYISSTPVTAPNVVAGITTGTLGTTNSLITTFGTTDSYMMFAYTIDNTGSGQTQYILNIKENINCDILIVGGGGGGGKFGGGGGGGSILFAANTALNSGSYTIRVGDGGAGDATADDATDGINGYDSSITINSVQYIAKGGGGGGSRGVSSGGRNGVAGGSGGGGSGTNVTTNVGFGGISNKNTYDIFQSFGNNGGQGKPDLTGPDPSFSSGGGGGAGSAGSDFSRTTGGGNGGTGKDFTSYFGTTIGDNGWFGGGGGGQTYINAGTRSFGNGGSGLFGGGGRGGYESTTAELSAENGLSNTGGGGGGSIWDGVSGDVGIFGGKGGSGIVIIRYRKNTITAFAGIGTTNPISELHVYDDTNNNTKLTIQNNYTDPIVITPNTGYTSVETLESNIYYRTLTFTYSPNYPENPPNATLLAWYKFDGDSLDYNPSSTKYNLITNTGTPTFSSGTSADSFFQGRRYLVYSSSSLKNSALLLRYRGFSVALWVRPKTGTGTYVWQYGYYDTGGTLYLGTASWTSPNNCYGIDVYNRGAYTSTLYPGDTNTWVHLVYIMDTNYSKRVYRNGVLIAINETADAFVGTGDLQILSNAADISDVRIYTTGLTNSDVEKLYNSYTSIVSTDNFAINFPNTTSLLVNGTSKTVKGQYNISTGNINSSVLPLEGQTDIPLASTTITTVAIKYPYNTNLPILPNEIGIDQYMVFTYTSDTVANSGQTQYTINIPTGGVICDILIVGGGGGGGMNSGGGGGAGGLIYIPNINLLGTYTINIGRGGAGGTQIADNTLAENGKDSSFGTYIAIGGGAGVNSGGANGNPGGSGGGAGNALTGNRVGGAGTAGQGNNGGDGTIPGGSDRTGGGGGGAGSVGQTSVSTSRGGSGGVGRNMSPYFGIIYGVNGWFAGGGGGGGGQGTGGTGGTGGGGNGGISNQEGINGTGGGGGGAHGNQSTLGKKGGSGIVIIKYNTIQTITSSPSVISQTVTRGIIGTTDRTISFTYTTDSSGLTGQTLYTFTPVQNLICDILIVGGGGGGGRFGGGGGGGGVLLGVNLKLNAGNLVSIKVGNGGTGSTAVNTGVNGIDGYNSSITINSIEYIAKGGGGGGSRNAAPYNGKNGNTGGSGGGGSTGEAATSLGIGGVSNKNIYANFQSFGNNGGKGKTDTSGTPGYASGGGGGAGSNGSDFTLTNGGGNGGLGKEFIAFFGRSVGHNGYFAGGGGGNTYYNAGNRGYGNGGLGLYGGGGNGAFDGNIAYFADNGIANTGGGGGGGNHNTYTNYSSSGGNGGSGFVIIRYRINTIQTSSVELIRNTVPPSEILVAGATSTTIGLFDRLISFPYTSDSTGLVGQTQYTFTTTENLICDILVIGGGGGGGRRHGGGGGAGTLIYQKNVIVNGTYTIKVGKGGQGCQSSGSVTANTIGYSSQFIKSDSSQEYLATGGGNGGAGTIQAYTTNGGGTNTDDSNLTLNTTNKINGNIVSVVNKQYVNTLISPEGCRGNMGGIMSTTWKGGGGGGAGGIGMDHNEEATVFDGYGGLGLAIDITGTSVIYAGGGNGSDYYGTISQVFDPSYPTIQSRGGGGFGSDNGTPQNGLDGTGGGGGGQGFDNANGGNGGSGIVIIRYRRNTGYKIGNYNGDFKIISSSTAGNTDYMRITADGASIYNPTGSPLWSTVSDRRIKENIEKASYDKCYDNINKLELYRFNYIKELNNINKDNKQLGYIAQEVEDIFPKAVSTQQFYNNSLSISDLLSIDISQINYTLYGSVKKLIDMYNDIEKRVEALEKVLNIENDLHIVLPEISTTTSNLNIDISTTNNISFYTPPETNIIVDTLTTSNIIDILSASTMSIYTSNNIIYDISTSNNISFYTLTETNIIIDIKDSNSSNIAIE